MAGIPRDTHDTPQCVEPGCAKPRYLRFRLCKEHRNGNIRAQRRQKNGKEPTELLTPSEVAERAARNYRSISERPVGVTDPSAAYAHALDVGGVAREVGEGDEEVAIAVLEKRYPRLRAILEQLDSMQVVDED